MRIGFAKKYMLAHITKPTKGIEMKHNDIQITATEALADGSQYFIGCNPSPDSIDDINENPPGLGETRNTDGAFAVYQALAGGGIQCMEIYSSISECRSWIDTLAEDVLEFTANEENIGMGETRKHYQCSECGESRHIHRDGFGRWDNEKQEWYFCDDVSEGDWCGSCDTFVDLIVVKEEITK